MGLSRMLTDEERPELAALNRYVQEALMIRKAADGHRPVEV